MPDVAPDSTLYEQPTANRAQRRAPAHVVPRVADRIIRESECREISGLSRSTRWRLEKAGLFPRKRQLSPHCWGWLFSEVVAWVAERARQR